MNTVKNFKSLNISTPPSYSGWLGSAWFVELNKNEDKKAIEEERVSREKYQTQIKNEKFTVIVSHNLNLKEVIGDNITFFKETDTERFSYSITFSGEKELKEITNRYENLFKIGELTR